MSESAAMLRGLPELWAASAGDPEICVAALDGPVDVLGSCFRGARLDRVETLVSEEAGAGSMSAHGTHVASLIFGQPDSPVRGIAPKCRGLIRPVFRDYEEGHLSQLDLARAIEQAVQSGAHIINVSGGERSPRGQADDVLANAVRLCERSNVLLIAAVGNDGCECLHVPAALSGVLAVGALDATGRPLDISNWGKAYRTNGVLAPGQNIRGAVSGGGVATFTGSSFATPIVSGVAALLLSIRRRNGNEPNPNAAREAILKSATPCDSPTMPDCPRYLVGVLDVPGAYALTQKGRKMSDTDATFAAPQAEGLVARPNVGAAGVSEAGVIAAGFESSARSPTDSSAQTANIPNATAGAVGVQPAQLPYDPAGYVPVPTSIFWNMLSAGTPGPRGILDVAPTPGPPVVLGQPNGSVLSWPTPQAVAPHATAVTPSGVLSSGNCGCNNGAGLENGKLQNIFALGLISYDFGTEARRDTFRQSMPNVGGIPANPFVPSALCDYLDKNPWESPKLIWTLDLETTPIYVLEAESAYAEYIYQLFRDAVRFEAVDPNDESLADPTGSRPDLVDKTNAQLYVGRVSVSGFLTGKNVRLFSGQVVPVVRVQRRGLYAWNTNQMVASLQALAAQQASAQISALSADLQPAFINNLNSQIEQFVTSYLNKVYYQLRNLGQASPDRALNYSATNVFQATSIGLLVAQPGQNGMVQNKDFYFLDTISVTKSPFCRFDSDCWDVQMTFFDPVNVLQARIVAQFTVDVSDELPVTIGPPRIWTTSQGVFGSA